MTRLKRREAMKCLAVMALTAGAGCALAADPGVGWKLATFSADVTPPIGHTLLASQVPAATAVSDPLFAKGLVIFGGDQAVVLVAVDWCEIRGEAYDRWRTVLAEAADTTADRVLLASVHQHDTPLADLEAERIIEQKGFRNEVIDPKFHEETVQRVATALRQALAKAHRLTHIGTGKARVEQIASNRRYLGPDGQVRHDRRSSMARGQAADQPEGTIDPWLRTLSFWDEDTPLAALSTYATHPMSYYRTGQVSADFPGLARARRQADLPDMFQMYMSGASGNVVAGKYNDGSPQSRKALVDRLHQAMIQAWDTTQRIPLQEVKIRTAPIEIKVRETAEYSPGRLEQRLSSATAAERALAALGMSWQNHLAAGHAPTISALDFGITQFVLLPAESYVEFQLMAQQLRPDSFVIVAGYGECGPGYIPTEAAFAERDSNLNEWCWTEPGAEQAMATALKAVLVPSTP